LNQKTICKTVTFTDALKGSFTHVNPISGSKSVVFFFNEQNSSWQVDL